MASLLFTIGDAVMNALALSGTNFVFSRLMDYGEEERKRHDLALKKLQKARDKWNKDQMKWLDFIEKRPGEKKKKMKQGHISTTLKKQCLSTIESLQNK